MAVVTEENVCEASIFPPEVLLSNNPSSINTNAPVNVKVLTHCSVSPVNVVVWLVTVAAPLEPPRVVDSLPNAVAVGVPTPRAMAVTGAVVVPPTCWAEICLPTVVTVLLVIGVLVQYQKR